MIYISISYMHAALWGRGLHGQWWVFSKERCVCGTMGKRRNKCYLNSEIIFFYKIIE